MNLRLDTLLARLRHDEAGLLAAIDADPLLLKKTSGDLVLANPSLELYTPQIEHQLFAKGIVYQRNPYRLVSLPLVKIYNLGEREVTVGDLAGILTEPGVRLHFLRKLDGSLIQTFAHDGRLWLTTRGTIEGMTRGPASIGFDFIGTGRKLLQRQAPELVAEPSKLQGRTLVFELLHPGDAHITRYGEREELVLIGAFDRRRMAYLGYGPLRELATELGLSIVDDFSPPGATLADQIEGLLMSLRGTDQEGSVLTFEAGGEVIYRVKVKTPDYLKLLRAMALCSYERAAEILEVEPNLTAWEQFETHLRGLGSEAIPEEVMPFYRPHFDRYRAFEAGCVELRDWAIGRLATVRAELDPALAQGTPAFRKAFAAAVIGRPGKTLLFAALDGKLDLAATRRMAGDLDGVGALLAEVQGQSDAFADSG